MTENLNWLQKLSNRFFSVPSVAQAWARMTAGRTAQVADLDGDIPFHRLAKPLSECRFALITTGGVHLRGQPPFDMNNPDGDPSYREIPLDADPADIVITHKYYDHSDADADLNVIFPLDHFRDLAAQSIVGTVAPRHYGFMGHIDGPLVADLTKQTAPEVADALQAGAVDCVFLTPA